MPEHVRDDAADRIQRAGDRRRCDGYFPVKVLRGHVNGEPARAGPGNLDRGMAEAIDAGAEIAVAGLERIDIGIKGPVAAGITVPDGEVAGSDRGGGEAAKSEDVAGGEGESHYSIPGERFLCFVVAEFSVLGLQRVISGFWHAGIVSPLMLSSL